MRRITSVGRSPGGVTSATTKLLRPTGSHDAQQRPPRCTAFSTASPSAAPHTSVLRQRSTTPSTCPPRYSRSYSADKQSAPASTKLSDQTPQPGTEVQFRSRVADDIINSAELDNLVPEEDVVRRGPFAPIPPRMEAARENEVADPTYVPAYNSKGLEIVGDLERWWDKSKNWDTSGDFVGFRPRQKITDPALIEAAVRRAVIEAFALREVGREDDLMAVWPTFISNADVQSLLAWDVQSDENGAVTLGGHAESVVEGLQWKDIEHSVGGDQYVALSDALTPEEAFSFSQTWNPSWKSISLADPRIRFAVTKRVFHLTGLLTPDYQLFDITTVQTLLHVLKKPPKPVTLMEEIEKRHPNLLEIPNVTVAAKRVTRGDKEKALGRYKVMQKEFKKRELPGVGHGNARKNRELEYVRGQI